MYNIPRVKEVVAKKGEANLSDVDTGVYELRRLRKKKQNSRVLSVYFKSRKDLATARKAARKAKVPLATFIRDAALKLAEKVLAA
jgi:IMP cyclohydrolase